MNVHGMLVVPSHCQPEMEEEFNRWYDTEHVPEREAIEGFLTARRFRCVSGLEPKYLALYDLTSAAVLESPAYRHLRAAGRTDWALSILERHGPFTRYICNAPDVVDSADLPLTPYVQAVVGLGTEQAVAALADWFDTLHAPAMREVPGVRLVRRLEAIGEPTRMIAIYDLDSPAVCESPAYLQQLERSGAWRYFHHLSSVVAKVYEQIYPARSLPA